MLLGKPPVLPSNGTAYSWPKIVEKEAKRDKWKGHVSSWPEADATKRVPPVGGRKDKDEDKDGGQGMGTRMGEDRDWLVKTSGCGELRFVVVGLGLFWSACSEAAAFRF